MRIWIVVVWLLLAGVAEAQVPQVACSRPADVYESLWDQMSPWEKANLCASRDRMGATYRVEAGLAHPLLGVVGVLVAAAGFGVAFHPNEHDYRVLGSSYCVGDYFVDAGRCGSARERQIGLAMMGAGVSMAWIGLRSKTVVIRPSLTGGAVDIRWGSRR